ncbi:hypothetical protein LCGC14_1287760 [marine sediment metagenome]|uniref:Uncharacterized protein n=1 Tax=marine sediment metagenome TaxID=412755 RepID=A0A0F9KTD1_9ZZZZ
MNVIAYTAKRYERATRRVVGRRAVVITCPPYDDGYFVEGKIQYGLFGNYDLAVFNLHGFPNLPVWLGDDQLIAMKGSTLSSQRHFAKGVFAINCNLGDIGHPMLQCLWDAGAEWVVAGDGLNYGGTMWPVGTDILLRWFRRSLEGKTPEQALVRAKKIARWVAPQFTADQRLALRDALKFEVHRN